ncbi:solute carrier family 12 member 9-like [Ciona intestinalis]
MATGGTDKDLLINKTSPKSDYAASHTSVRLSSIVDHDQNALGPQQPKLSTFFGVVVPCCLSMFSVILFLRMGFIVGQAGMLEGLAMLLLAYSIIGLTVLSVCAISTNGAIEGGGAYFMISRALGPEFGGAIGLMFFLANVASTALYIFGLVEAMLSFFGPEGQLQPQHINAYVCITLQPHTTILTPFICSFLAKPLFILKSNVTMVHMNVLHECNATNVTYTSFSEKTFRENLGYDWTIDYTTLKMQNFVIVFAVLFNGCTGIMAGANMSGDLKNPSRSIPVGTISACLITFVVYMALIVLISATTPRSILHCNYSFLLTINLWGPFIAIGVFASSLSAALSCLIGASRILYALARDDLFGIILRPMTKSTSSGNPIVAVLFSWFLVQMTLFVGQLNTIAPIVTIFFLISYAATDLACLALEWASAPNFRPTFKLFTWHTCVLGFLSCVIMMFLIQALYTSVSVVVLIILLIIIHYRVPTSSWGYISQALIFHQVRKYMLMLDVRKEHVKFWRPQILLMVKNPRSSCQLIEFINSIKKSGLYVLGHVSIGSLSEMESDILKPQYNHWLNLVDEMGVKAFVELTLSKSVREGTEHLLRISGLGGMKPNTLVLGFHDNLPQKDTFKDLGIFKGGHSRTGSSIASIISHEQPLEEDDAFDSGSFFPDVVETDDSGKLSTIDYVAIIADAIKLQKNVCLARYFNQLDKTSMAQDKAKVHYIDVWPVNFLTHIVDRRNNSDAGTSTFRTTSSSFFDTTCVFLMQMACILNMTPFWKNRTKLRIFLFTETSDDSTAPGDEELEEFLKTVRIKAEIKPVKWGDVATSSDQTATNSQSNYSDTLKKINSLIRSQHSSTAVTFLYLPTPPMSMDQCVDYIDMLTQISDNLGPTLFVHGLSHVISTTL